MRLNGTREAIEDADYPCTTRELLAACGDAEVEYVGGTDTVEGLLGRIGDTTFESAEEARLELYNCAPPEAVGRRGYSDRDPDPSGVDGEQVSF